jgi:hypothetical protein
MATVWVERWLKAGYDGGWIGAAGAKRAEARMRENMDKSKGIAINN